MACRPFIFLRKGAEDLLEHEMFHLKQQKEIGWFTYMWNYSTDRHFRYSIELEAYLKGSKMPIEEAAFHASKYR
jgi:hypothetical protein